MRPNPFISLRGDVPIMSQPQLSDEVRDWYWRLVERFRFGYAFYRNFSTELLGKFVVLGYKLISLFGCKQLAMARHWRDAYFRCGDMIVRYWVEFAPEPKRELRKRIEELERRLKDELFSIEVSFPFFDTTIGMGEQPRIGSVLGTYRIQRIELSYEPGASPPFRAGLARHVGSTAKGLLALALLVHDPLPERKAVKAGV